MDSNNIAKDMMCQWVGDFPGMQCKTVGTNSRLASEACPMYCRDECAMEGCNNDEF